MSFRIFFLLFLGSFFISAPFVFAQNNFQATIFYNEACSECSVYIKEELIPALEKLGGEIEIKDYIANPQFRKELTALNDTLQIPPSLYSHFTTFIDSGRIVLAGHIPLALAEEALTMEKEKLPEKLIIWQDQMEGAKTYRIFSPQGGLKEYPLGTSLTEYLADLEKNAAVSPLKTSRSFSSLLPLVLSSGFLDGLNPCAFAVLLFFIAFLFTIKKSRSSIFKMGGVYIAAIFLAYFLIGLGLVKAIIFSQQPHFFARLGAYLVIILGTISLLNLFWPRFPIKLRLPGISWPWIEKWLSRATIPTAFVAGFLVGLCTFPCSGGIYVAIIGLLAAKTTYLPGLFLMILYNIMFVLPLVLILLLAGNKIVVERMENWRKNNRRNFLLISGAAMIILGLIILIWFV